MKMELKLKSAFKRIVSLPLLVALLSSCNSQITQKQIYAFDTFVSVSLQNAKENTLNDIETTLNYYHKLFDGYNSYSGLENLNSLNTNRTLTDINEDLKEIISLSKTFSTMSNYYNPLVKKLGDTWTSINEFDKTTLPTIISGLLDEMNASSITINETSVTINGNADIDLGAVAKGYALNKIEDIVKRDGLTHYIIDEGTSSILLGEKNAGDGYFRVGIESLPNTFLKLKNIKISTSSILRGYIEFEGKKYSHIVNPLDGYAVSKWDTVFAVGNDGCYLDAATTIGMMTDLKDFPSLESNFNCKMIAIKDSNVVYKNGDLTLYVS